MRLRSQDLQVVVQSARLVHSAEKHMPPRAERSTKTRRAYLRLVRAVAHNLRLLRLRRGWSQEEAARQSEMSVRVYQRVEAGTGNLTLITLARLCQAFQVEGAELLAIEPKTTTAKNRNAEPRSRS